MNTQRVYRLVLGLALFASMVLGTTITHAQPEFFQTESYTWQPYGLTIQYPTTWIVVETPEVISLHPADRDVSHGKGPEIVLFARPGVPADQLDRLTGEYVASFAGESTPPVAGTLEDRPTRSFTFDRDNPDTMGGMTLIAVEDDTVLILAYIVRDTETAIFLPTLQAMLASATFGAMTETQTANHTEPGGEHVQGDLPDTITETPIESSSQGVASVQLPQQYAWEATGLALYFPEDWSIETTIEGDALSLTAQPPLTSMTDDSAIQLIQATTLAWYPGVDLRSIATATAAAYDATTEVHDITVAGYPAILFDLLDSSSGFDFYMRGLVLDLADRETSAMIIFGATESGWESFRPLVNAFIDSIERLDAGVSWWGGSGIHGLASQVHPDTHRRWQEGDPPTKPFVWEEFGATFDIPSDWQGVVTTQQYDMALVSPEAQAGEELGAFIGFSNIPYLSATRAPADILSEQFEGEVSTYTFAGYEGATITIDDPESDAIQHLFLIPYNDSGHTLFIVAIGGPDSTDVLYEILDSATFDVPAVDYAVLDAAWQASLAADGVLAYGPADAPVTMVEFLSFTCGHCMNYSADVERLMALEVEQGRLRIELGFLAGESEPLSYAATVATYCAAEQGKGYTAYKTLFYGAVTEDVQTAYTREEIENLLGQPDVGIDMDALTACMDTNPHAERINDIARRFYAAGLTGTPGILLAAGDDEPERLILPDGQAWIGGIPIPLMQEIVEAVISDGLSIAEVFGPVPGADDTAGDAADTNAGEEEGAVGASATGGEAGDKTSYQPLTLDTAANVEQAKTGDNDDSNNTGMLLVAGGAALASAAVVGLVFVSRRQTVEHVTVTPGRADHEGDTTDTDGTDDDNADDAAV